MPFVVPELPSVVQANCAPRFPSRGWTGTTLSLGNECPILQNCGMTQETIARVRINLNDIGPEIWRIVEMPVAGSLKMLHDVIQAAMGWQDYHLWHFEAGERRYGVPNPEWPDRNLAAARNVKLGTLIDRDVRRFTYTYDMGDDWRHTVVVEAVELGEHEIKYPRFVTGERRCPPEDVGGLPGFERFLQALSDVAHEEHQQLYEWYGGPFDPLDIDEVASKNAVAAIAIRRHAGKVAYEKSRNRH